MEENTVDHDSTTYMKVHVPDLNHKGDHASSQCMDPTRVMLASQLFMEPCMKVWYAEPKMRWCML